ATSSSVRHRVPREPKAVANGAEMRSFHNPIRLQEPKGRNRSAPRVRSAVTALKAARVIGAARR
ncbi:MAG: hypothetical protein REI11_00525, partial [Patulibacter sp.]|nr:hypothetical protein [Patulibacter sp.]